MLVFAGSPNHRQVGRAFSRKVTDNIHVVDGDNITIFSHTLRAWPHLPWWV